MLGSSGCCSPHRLDSKIVEHVKCVSSICAMKKARSHLSASNYSLSALIRRARGNLTQNEFGRVVGVSQTLLSKYESGAIPNPPASVIEKCLELVDTESSKAPPDASTVARRVESTLSGPEHASLRQAISDLLDLVAQRVPPKAVRRPR